MTALLQPSACILCSSVGSPTKLSSPFAARQDTVVCSATARCTRQRCLSSRSLGLGELACTRRAQAWSPGKGLYDYRNRSTWQQASAMPRYYCDYCDTYLTHDSVSLNSLYASPASALSLFLIQTSCMLCCCSLKFESSTMQDISTRYWRTAPADMCTWTL